MKQQLSPRKRRALAQAEDDASDRDFQKAVALVRRAQADSAHAYRTCKYLPCLRHRRCSVEGEPCVDALPADCCLDFYAERVAIDEVHEDLVWARRRREKRGWGETAQRQ